MGWGRSQTTRKAVFSYLVSLLKKKKKKCYLVSFVLDKWIWFKGAVFNKLKKMHKKRVL